MVAPGHPELPSVPSNDAAAAAVVQAMHRRNPKGLLRDRVCT